MSRTLLGVSDGCGTGRKASTTVPDSFYAQSQLLRNHDIEIARCDYNSLLAGRGPGIATDALTIALFFPYNHWNDAIEIYPDNRIYGDRIFGKKFNDFFDGVEEAIISQYHDKAVGYVNSPKAVQLDRDKKRTKEVLANHGIPVPETLVVASTEQLLKSLNDGSIYLKPRFGAMGKGISYLSQDRWLTNFTYENGRIVSRDSDYGWTFRDVTGCTSFLDELLAHDVIAERAIDSPLIGGRKFDMRIYVVYGQVPYIYARSALPDSPTTNISQGARTETDDFNRRIPLASLSAAKERAVQVATCLGLNFVGVDIIFSQDWKAYVLEAQSFPSYESRFDLMRYLAERI